MIAQSSAPILAVAPMEGLTGAPFRRVHAKFFGPAPCYYLPFVTPTTEPRFTARQLARELDYDLNRGLNVVPQLLTRRSEDFIWAAKALADLGYKEVNLNLGCPAGTVVAKGKGSGFLQEPVALRAFLDQIFSADLPIAISVKTRIGYSHEEEFGTLVDLYNNFAEAMASLTIHPRLRTDFYKGDLRVEVFNRYFNELRMPVGYNGDVITVGDIDRIRHRYQSLKMIMVGRALMADPALFRKAAGGNAATLPEIVSFYEALFDSYAQAFQSRKNALMRMKEYWFFQHNLFVGAERAVKLIYKAKTLEDYQAAIENIFENFELGNEATYGWKKPL